MPVGSLRGHSLLVGVALVVLALSCGHEEEPRSGSSPDDPGSGFPDRTASSGITFVNHTGISSEKHWLVESKGGGAIALDYDGDGLLDLYLIDGNTLLLDATGCVITRMGNHEAGNRLYRNEGDWHFRDVTGSAGVGDPSFGIGGTCGDFDNDGDPDIFICNWGSNVLYRNNGDGTYTDVTAEAGVAGPDHYYSSCAAFFDADNDGDLDLYVSNYGDNDRLMRAHRGKPPGLTRNGIWYYDGPRLYDALPDFLYLNQGDGTFRDVSEEALENQMPRYAFQPVPFDVDNDGDLDLYVANDTAPNYLWINDGKAHFHDEAYRAGCALNQCCGAQAGMGADAADFNRDGLLDLIVTTFAADSNTIYRNAMDKGRVFFEDISSISRVTSTCHNRVCWGVAFVDFDLDGVLDLFFSTGHVYPRRYPRQKFLGTFYEELPSLMLGSGPPDWSFKDVSKLLGPDFQVPRLGRGTVFADFDNDGDTDLLQTCLNGPVHLMENRLPKQGRWLRLKLEGTASNRDGIGTRVVVETDEGRTRQLVEHRLAYSFGSSNDPVISVGLGQAETAERILVTWPSGLKQEFRDVKAGHTYLVREREGADLVIR